ncbi:hypothetical protein H2199_005265 [Coniosporium tulheliwenetii]|uniref:Uncharacterized protein n=1 Tax=Coniosporium tulheliwenetii TaxID=3383036 RepID=A0ACC2Z2U2_9PEZI|nr:hypothetical protein H2199_005265 [Cladosporium sp. JES 115]
MAILLTGGTGKTSIRIARLLQDANIPFLLASRNAETGAPSGMSASKFDWLDSSTFENPFRYDFPNGESISAVYLVAPTVADPVPALNALIDLAVSKGVKRFVLLAGSTTEPGGHHVGQIWQRFIDTGLEYCVLRPTWFMENFSEWQHLATIKDEGKIYTACGDGKIPFISATDIAAVAFHALTDERPHNTDYRVLGPELLTHDEIAAKLSSGLGREIVHVKLSEEEAAQRYLKLGLPDQFAKFMSYLEAAAARGDEERSNDAVERVSGRPPLKFDEWVQQNKKAWQ